eukprot:SAG25_NODE_3109_length_1214_cov_1.054709_1_plen_32_part_01
MQCMRKLLPSKRHRLSNSGGGNTPRLIAVLRL